MNWLLSIVIAVLTGALGIFCGALLGSFNVRWYRISGFEGNSGYYCAALALLGAVVGLVGGLIVARVVASGANPSFLKGLGCSTGGLVGLTLVITAICWLAADLRPTIGGKSLELAIEVRAPRRFNLEFPRGDYGPMAYLENSTGKTMSVAEFDFTAAKKVDGRWIIPAVLSLNTSSSGKRVRAFFNKEFDAFVSLRLRGNPRKADLEWSEWQESAWNSNQPRPSADEAFFVRSKVQVVEPPPPGPSQEEIAAKEAAEDQAAFDAIPADAPITTWLPFTEYGAREDRLKIAIHNIQARERFVEELGALINGDDHETAAKALCMIRHLEVFPAELNPQVAAAGRKISEVIRAFNGTSVEQDPSMMGAANASIRFHSWMEAVRTLREKAHGDFMPELQEILTLSRVREDSHCMQADIRRVASYYLKEWAGVAPLAGDPPPR